MARPELEPLPRLAMQETIEPMRPDALELARRRAGRVPCLCFVLGIFFLLDNSRPTLIKLILLTDIKGLGICWHSVVQNKGRAIMPRTNKKELNQCGIVIECIVSKPPSGQ